MGCAQSKIDNEESVSRCKDRRNLMKDAVIARNAFAAGQSGYTVSLKNIGAALSDYGHGEAEEDQHQPMDPTPPPPPPPPPPSSIDGLPPPPPPLPNFSPSPIKRAVSLPSILLKNRKHAQEIDNDPIIEDGEEEEDDDDDCDEEEEDEVRGNGSVKHKLKKHIGGRPSEMSSATTTPPRTPERGSVPNAAWDYFFMVDNNLAGTSLGTEEQNINSAVILEENADVSDDNNDTSNTVNNDSNNNVNELEKAEKKVIEHASTAPPEFSNRKATVNLMQVLSQIDERFLRASESAHEVSNLLEATRVHYHSNFADNRAHIDHSARVMRVITWNRSFKGISNGEGGKDNFDSEEHETLANVLDKMLAWEKKLYEEVKQGELMKFEYQRKVAVLNKQKKRKASAESLEKTKATVSHLHTRYIVDMQSMDSTVSEVNRLRDEQLYPKLVALVDGMSKMWESMCMHHDSQLEIVTNLKSLDVAHAPKETTKQHHDRTKQLYDVIQKWHFHFEKLVNHQKQFIQALNGWLKLDLIPIESSLKERISSPPRAPNPPIQGLLQSWHDYLGKLPDELAKSAISSFAAVIKTIILHQEEEMKLKEKCEETEKEFLRKKQAYDEWYQKYMQRRNLSESEAEKVEDANTKDPVSEREFVVESLKKRLEEEVEAYKRHFVQVREKSVGSLKIRLPELFRAMSDYAHACFGAYENLRSIILSQNSTGGYSH